MTPLNSVLRYPIIARAHPSLPGSAFFWSDSIHIAKMADADSWDVDTFEPDEPGVKTAVTLLDRWEGEDEDEDVKDNWDDDEDEKQASEKKPEVKTEASQKKKLNEKERKKQVDKVRTATATATATAELTPEEAAAERLRAKQLQEASDLELANDAFGITNSVPVATAVTGIDALRPSSKDDFTDLHKLLKEKISQYERSVHYSGFLESLFRDLCISLEVEDLKKISNSLTVLLNEKQKQEKQNKAKKKKKGVVPGGGLKAKLKDELVDYDDFDGGYTQDYEDFM
ncbi:eukaryotic translation initiation factor 3 subunit J-B isoform X1 [Anguilla rostrata]|uniref:eukaryotic translation initiation factor 3 subunit J-B isoform X1 n=1 Tax=Anguilla rostrata TaxID=7938 RepID=UPI0030CFA3FA